MNKQIVTIPQINSTLCSACGECVLACPDGAVSLPDSRGPLVNDRLCSYCGLCEDICPSGAVILPVWIHAANQPG